MGIGIAFSVSMCYICFELVLGRQSPAVVCSLCGSESDNGREKGGQVVEFWPYLSVVGVWLLIVLWFCMSGL